MMQTQLYSVRNVNDMTQLRQDFARYQEGNQHEFSRLLGRTSSYFSVDVYAGYHVTILLDQISAHNQGSSESVLTQLCTVSLSGNTPDIASFKIKQLPHITSVPLCPLTEKEQYCLEEPIGLIATLGSHISVGED